MQKEIVVRKAARRDSQAFARLLVALASFEHLPLPTTRAKKRISEDIFKKKRLNLILAFLNNKPVGYALYFYTYSSFLAKPTLYLEDLFVLEEARRKGAGSRLFSYCVQEATAERCGRMEWSVLTWNKNAIRFYEKIGARRLDEWYYYRLDGKALKRAYHSSVK